MIEVKNLCKIYNKNSKNRCVALNNVSFTLPNTGMVFIVGKSGSGKSTMLNLIAGLDGYTSGDIIVNGVSFNDFTHSDFDNYRNQDIGFIFQDFCLMDNLTVYENVKFSLDLQRKADDELIQETLKQTDLEGLNHRLPKELSGGQKQRVAIARALVKKPKLILADEPTGNLDSATSQQVLKILKNISETNLVLIISHNYDDAMTYADRIIELSDGQIVKDVVRTEVEEFKLINKNTITLPFNRELTKKELALVNKKLKEGKAKIKQAKSDFVATTQPELTPTFTKPQKVKGLSFKDSAKMVKSLSKGYNLTMIVTALLTALLVIILGFSQIFSMFNGGEIISSAVNAQANSTFVLHKGYAEGEKYKVIKTDRIVRVTDSDIQSFYDNGYTGKVYKLYNQSTPIKPHWQTDLEFFKFINAEKSLSGFYASQGFGVLECDIDYLTRLYGVDGELKILATSSYEKGGIVIPDYFADSILADPSTSIDSSYQTLCDNASMWSFHYSIKAIFDTGYKTRYANLIEEYTNVLKKETRAERREALKALYETEEYLKFFEEVKNFLAIGYYIDGDLFDLYKYHSKTNGFLTRLTNAEIYDSEGKLISENDQTFFQQKDVTQGYLPEVGETDLYVGAVVYNKLFGTNCSFENQSQFKEQTITIKNYSPTRKDEDNPLYTITLTIKGLIHLDDYGFVCHKNVYDLLKSHQTVPYALYFENGHSAANLQSTITKNNFYSRNEYFGAIYTIMNIVNIFGQFFSLIAIALAVACVLMLISFGKRSVKRRMEEIGIMRALGAKTKHISRSFIMQVVCAGLITCALSVAGMMFLDGIFNTILLEGLMTFLGTDAIAGLTIIQQNPLITGINVGAVLLITIIAAIAPIIAVHKIKPINIIRNNE